jgi:hypothetical protein
VLAVAVLVLCFVVRTILLVLPFFFVMFVKMVGMAGVSMMLVVLAMSTTKIAAVKTFGRRVGVRFRYSCES